MQSFEEFFLENENSPIFNQIENIIIDGICDGSGIPCKIDSGNDSYCLIHGENIKPIDDGKMVSFDTVNNRHVELPIVDKIKVKFGAGHDEKRPVVKLSFKINGKRYENIEFSVGDRSQNDEKVLIGLKFLQPIKAIIKID